ncbi:MAG: oligosaccharide flippase family protein [Actinomycetota bacterium]|nr:oligosaccharide flippase family protein [Actinomycetota bacterium]MDP3630586.1 oligosaccharide flippase family protein [Actinomycetota bacterium]
MSRRRGVVFSYVLLAVEVASSLLFTPYLIRSLGQAEYGLYSLVASITAYFVLLDAGVGNALVRYIAKFRVSDDLLQQKRLLGLSVLYYSGIGVVVTLLGLLLQDNLASIFGGGLTVAELERAGTMLNITLLNAALALVISAFDRTIIAYERFVLSKCLLIARVILRVMVLTVLLYIGYRAVTVVLVNLVLTVVFGAIAVSFVLFGLRVRPMFSGIKFSFVREVLGYSTFIFIQMVATQISSMTDQVLLGIMTTSVTIGIYAVGAQVAMYFQSIAGSINSVLMPGVVRMVENDTCPEALSREMVKVGRLIFIVLGPILVGFAVCGRSFIRLWAGAANEQAYWVALILMTSMLLFLVQSIGSQILWAMGRHKVQAVLKIGVAVVNIALTVVLIRWRPLVGASLGTAIAYMLGDVVVMNVVFSRDIGISMKTYYAGLFRGVVPCLLLSGLVGGMVTLLDLPDLPHLVVGGTSILLVYAVTMVAFGMSSYERGLLSSLLRRTKAQT